MNCFRKMQKNPRKLWKISFDELNRKIYRVDGSGAKFQEKIQNFGRIFLKELSSATPRNRDGQKLEKKNVCTGIMRLLGKRNENQNGHWFFKIFVSKIIKFSRFVKICHIYFWLLRKCGTIFGRN